ncbi:unnamed protein product [Rhizoctonia solani]|uniref:Uncharacterized protein n=1 Tax=Rhizoctonia solani TaxID=456999 RepID=A0A8H3BCD4_9AGAM|nr:unnamed protein product [Rhizoctonia solani]
MTGSDTVYAGPLDYEPLTEKELAILLAIPHGAEKTPNMTIFRFPLGPEPALGWVDVTFNEARSIIASLAIEWKAKLSNRAEGPTVGPGMVHNSIPVGLIAYTVDSNIPWPEPQRPDPAIIIHSTGSTAEAKLLRFSLYFYTLSLPDTAHIGNTVLDRRPCLMFSPPHWQNFNLSFIIRLAAGIPMTFAHILDISKFPSSHFIGWAKGLDIGAVVCSARFIRDALISGSQENINFLQEMYNITVGGSALDETTTTLIEKYKLKFVNIFGCSELGGLLLARRPPYTHLRLFPGSSPLVLPVSNAEPDGSRQVQFWYSCSNSPPVAHLHAKGGVPLRFEPFPGEGPHKGEQAVRWDDIFKEINSR